MIRDKVSLDSVISADGWRGCNGLVDVGDSKHLRMEQIWARPRPCQRHWELLGVCLVTFAPLPGNS